MKGFKPFEGGEKMMIIINYSFEYTDGSIGYGEIESLKKLK